MTMGDQSQEETAQLEAKRQKNAGLPISRLPPEILGAIFLLLRMPFWRKKKTPPQFVVSYVSHAWRRVALGTTELWDTLIVRSWVSRKLLHLHLERSCARPLTIAYADDDPSMLDTLVRYIDRWSVVNLDIANPYPMLETLVPLRAPALKVFEVSIGNAAERAGDGQAVLSLFSNGAPALTSLRLHGISFDSCIAPLSHLQTLNVTCYHRTVRIDEIISALASTPLLTLLRLHFKFVEGMEEPRPPIPLHSLKSLGLLLTDRDDLYLARFCRLLDTPSLEKLHVSFKEGAQPYGSAFVDFLRSGRIGETLKTLHIDSAPPGLDVLRLLPGITDLMVQHQYQLYEPDIFQLLTLPPSTAAAEVIFPALRSVTLVHGWSTAVALDTPDYDPNETLRAMVASRMGTLESVAVAAHGMAHFEESGAMRWLLGQSGTGVRVTLEEDM